MLRLALIKKLVIYLVFVGGFISLFFASNYIVMFNTTDYYLKTDNLENYKYKQVVNYAVDRIEPANIWGKSYLSGWAFCETNLPNENRSITFIFVSSTNTYSLHTYFLSNRPDVVTSYKERDIVIKNPKVGYSRDFSTINMAEGVYQLYIYCNENDIDYGLIKTSCFFEKKGTSFTSYDWQSSVVLDEYLGEPSSKATAALDFAAIVDDNVELRGWALIKEQDCTVQNVFIRLTDSNNTSITYTTLSTTRTDISKGYNNEKYKESGYVAQIPAKDFLDGQFTLEVIIKNNDQIGISKVFTVSKDGGAIKIISK